MMQTSFKTRMLEAFRFRMYFFAGLVACFIFILLIQLINLQLVQGREYATRAKINMENHIPIAATRGIIYDRNYIYGSTSKVIASNRPSFNLSTVKAKFKSKKEMYYAVNNLAKLLDLDVNNLLAELKSKLKTERCILHEDVDFKTVVQVASHQNLFPNIDWEDAPVRVYNYQNMFAHTIGYIGAISDKEYKILRKRKYRNYQKIGKTGIEKQYDLALRGEDGFVRRIVDSQRRIAGEEISRKPVPGNNIITTLDFDVQKAAHDATENLKGTVIVLKPSTGGVIALLSRPDFDPNFLVSKNSNRIITALNDDKNNPFLNRAIQSRYPPASIFKLITAVAGLEEEKISPGKTFYCPGKYTLKGLKDRDFYCYESHGRLDLYWAIARSCSVYFYQLGYMIGPTTILKHAEYFGLNEKTGIDIPGEKNGFIPSKEWKLKRFSQRWYDGDTINLSIGQGFLAVTPMGMVNFMAALVNNGIVYQPHIVSEIRTPDNQIVKARIEPKKIREIPLSKLTLGTVKQGMRIGVTDGTSRRLSYLKVPVAGKTGTAQTRSKRMDNQSQHAWFAGYAPYGAPPEKAIVVIVMIEYGIAGAISAVPVAEKVFAKLYELGYFK